jgi:hypothetical protein
MASDDDEIGMLTTLRRADLTRNTEQIGRSGV